MERLTRRVCGGWGVVEGCELNTVQGMRKVVEQLAAYENTELTPEEIITLKSIKSYADAAEHEIVRLVQVERQRNEAIEDIPHTCEYCAYNGVDADSSPCADCERLNVLFGDDCWKWHGLKEG